MATHHDALFRAAFAEPRVAAAWIRSVVPATVAQRIDWTTLAVASADTRGPRLSLHLADLVFEAQLLDGSGKVLFVLEHKSALDSGTRDQVYRYAILRKHWFRRQKRDAPPVVTIVLQQGPAAPPPPRAHAPEHEPDPFAPLQPTMQLLVEDLANVTEDDLRSRGLHPLATLTLLALRTLPQAPSVNEALGAIARWKDLIDAERHDEGPPNPDAILETLGWYVLEVTDVTEEQLPMELKQPQQDAYGGRMTTGQRIRMEARAEGMEAGRRDAERRTLLRQLERRFGTVPAAVAAHIQTAALPQLEAWLDRIFDLRAPEDLLAAD
jgi:hypothetical protein